MFDDAAPLTDRLLAEEGAEPHRRESPAGDHGGLPNEADHYRIAQNYVDRITASTGVSPVFTLGKLWVLKNDLWVPVAVEQVPVEIGQRYGGMKFCQRGSDFNAVAKIAFGLVGDDKFFASAPPGVACPSGFWRITDCGEIACEPLGPEHRQRMRLSADPDFETEAPLFDRLLNSAFGQDERGRAQTQLLQVAFGGALARSLWRHRVATLLLGATTSGKSTLLSVLKSLFPDDQVTATSPQRWESEYYLASLAGSAVNIVGELDPGRPIPGGAFKQVLGGDVVEGRHPTHRPFSFVPQAAHFFNANRLPPTVDRSDAFFRRWRILHFPRSVADDEIIVDLDQQIVEQEIGSVIAWMLEGAAYLARYSSVPETIDHRQQLEKWRNANNSALQFLTDGDACDLDPGAETSGGDLYHAYTKWALDNGVKAFGRNGFYEAIDEGAGRLGVRRKDARLRVAFSGVLVIRT